MTKRAREILDFYRSENAGVLSNLARMINHGRLAGTGTFVIADSAITAATTITAVTFDFGTGPDTFIPGVLVPAPSIGHGLPVLLAIGGILSNVPAGKTPATET